VRVTHEDIDPFRLPRTVIPSRYELTIETDLDTATFSGTEAIAVDVHEPVSEIVLNALELEIDEAWLEAADQRRIDATVTIDKDAERAFLALAESVPAGAYTLHAAFRGILNEKLVGFYRSTFKHQDGHEATIATTQFEATHARQAFPCWDEPDMKAVFGVTLVVADGLEAVSNGGELRREVRADGKQVITFLDTMKMSTYLVAFVVGPLEITPPVMVDNTPLRIVHPPGQGHLTKFALEVGAAALTFFADYYGIVYPGDKLDMVALPDFAFGAMENVGCITYREALLLVDPEGVSQSELQRVADVIAHEIAHQWFGNLVTMKWWNGIWLNEAFATFMEMKATDEFRPDWERWVDFGLSRTGAFDVDSLESTRPIEYEVVSPHDAEGMFDVLTYEKGAAVVRMLDKFLGEDDFRDGIRHYLARHQFGNTETTDLWDAIEETSGHPVRRMMDSWIFQGGYPLLSVELAGDDRLHVTQERFRYDDGTESHDDHPGGGELWVVPAIIEYGNEGNVRTDKVVIDTYEHDVQLAFTPDWVVANAGGTGFYRVKYSTALLDDLVRRGTNHLTSLERYGLVDDAFAAVLNGRTAAAEFLDFVRSFGEETDVSVWQRIIGALGALDRLVDGDDRANFQAAVRGLIGPALVRMGQDPSPDEGDRTRELRAALMEALGVLGDDEEAHAKARELHTAYLADRHAVDPNLAAAAIAVIAETGTADEYEQFVSLFQSSPTPQEQLRYLYALGRFHDDALVQRTLAMSISTQVRTQNAAFLLRVLLMNRAGGQAAWRFVRQNWETINERLPTNSIVRMLDGIRTLTQPEVANDVFGFFAEHQVPQGAKTLAQHLEKLLVNVTLAQREATRFPASL
jgi:puromycin-sensitive aminopeptidase